MSKRNKSLLVALALYAAWTAATWLLEGRIRTFTRPGAVTDRLVYAVAGNLVLGVALGSACIAYLVHRGAVEAVSAGFGTARRTMVAAAAGLVIGAAAYVLQGAPSLDPVVVLNGFSQVFVVSAAEVVVCWCVVGSTVEAAVSRSRTLVATVVAALVSALLFGAYHFAHSPPFNTWGMVTLLSAVGLVTGAFFFISRDVIGTTIFHNFLGVFGVLKALEAADALSSFERVQPQLVATAGLTLALLVVLQAVVRRQQLRGGRGALAARGSA
ncbi:hypothetical protein JI739_21990 [Ramlibacter sp. AW1]|uniref:Uncharacterized protein n=1 Tax=Ramlibacter aurantiacus TaxID=2801330 RepID=A0A936ZKI8_9BURK|nr:hypothetical protein [Ramlibacter aurantiacus]MBL0423024.1 hypothetical protein [Ramlibacter aurantiacus]